MSEKWDHTEPEYSTHYPSYSTPKKAKAGKGLLTVMIVLVLLSTGITVLNIFFDLHMEVTDNKVSLVMGDEQQEEEVPAQEMAVLQHPWEQEHHKSGGLQVHDTPQSVENRPFTEQGALSLQQIYEKVAPSVASISCVHAGGSSAGSGIVMSRDGYVITNYHVVDGAQKIYVQLSEQPKYEARLVGGDRTTDLAVLKIEAEDLIAAEFGNSDALRVGDGVVAIGDPFGTRFRGTMTDGIVCAINRDFNLAGWKMTLIQTNAAVNSGNSGGPLINCYGQVIGINTARMSAEHYDGSKVEGLGFAIPIMQVKSVLDELVVQGYVSGRPAIGIEGQVLDLRAQLFYRLPAGVCVIGFVEDSRAVQQLQLNDVIVNFNGSPIASLDDLVQAKEGLRAGDEVWVTVFRDGKEQSIKIELMEQILPDIY